MSRGLTGYYLTGGMPSSKGVTISALLKVTSCHWEHAHTPEMGE